MGAVGAKILFWKLPDLSRAGPAGQAPPDPPAPAALTRPLPTDLSSPAAAAAPAPPLPPAAAGLGRLPPCSCRSSAAQFDTMATRLTLRPLGRLPTAVLDFIIQLLTCDEEVLSSADRWRA